MGTKNTNNLSKHNELSKKLWDFSPDCGNLPYETFLPFVTAYPITNLTFAICLHTPLHILIHILKLNSRNIITVMQLLIYTQV